MKILFIISGSIAAKKSINVLNILKKKGVYANCIVTESAKKIININSLKGSITGNIYSNSSEKNKRMLHILLTRENDLVVVCPATANIIAKFANGYADDLASTSLIAVNKQILIVPAMNVRMWENPINLNNVLKLQKNGIEFIGPEYGHLSCGELGHGRLSNENKISTIIWEYLNQSKELVRKTCIVTAGPTIESIDAVRYISNNSSGKQGYEIAKQLSLKGARVILITGPTSIPKPANVKIINIITANEMNRAVQKKLPVDIAIFTAAVSDIKPKKFKDYKITKNNLKNILLAKNPDIIKNVSLNRKKRPQLVIGFTLETNNVINNARKKIKSKKCDWMVANKLGRDNQVFGSNLNKITIVKKEKIKRFKKMTKINTSKIIIKEIIKDLIKN